MRIFGEITQSIRMERSAGMVQKGFSFILFLCSVFIWSAEKYFPAALPHHPVGQTDARAIMIPFDDVEGAKENPTLRLGKENSPNYIDLDGR